MSRVFKRFRFFVQIIWSKRRRSLFFILTVLAFLVDVGLVLRYLVQLPTHQLPPTLRHVFLGYNFIYNTQVGSPLHDIVLVHGVHACTWCCRVLVS